MSDASPGLHHVTAICGHPRANRDFYVDTLGLRLVKKTVNFDDPGTYHLYYGDQYGTPGSALTFFPFVQAAAGRPGRGEPADLVWAVAPGSLDYWAERLGNDAGVAIERGARFGTPRLSFSDPHGLSLALVETDWAAAINGSAGGDVPAQHALRNFFGTTIRVADPAPTVRVLREVFGFEDVAEEGPSRRLQAEGGAGVGAVVDVLGAPEAPVHRQGAGSIHHVAFRARDVEHQTVLRERAQSLGLSPTPVIDRQYFESVYFREPGGALFEIATDGPGFTVDEPVETLGGQLKLPPQYEAQRPAIEAQLPLI
ncbi:ring-cleaving dioxygenase [Salinisphaera sp. SPP-AMP-43]|uniref:ring-cleaving dioxygenase n=1 Tax=Salinisphaera sp. SPP-AMP-43 TaxID=3121288 RepID=UPI003C6DC681